MSQFCEPDEMTRSIEAWARVVRKTALVQADANWTNPDWTRSLRQHSVSSSAQFLNALPGEELILNITLASLKWSYPKRKYEELVDRYFGVLKLQQYSFFGLEPVTAQSSGHSSSLAMGPQAFITYCKPGPSGSIIAPDDDGPVIRYGIAAITQHNKLHTQRVDGHRAREQTNSQ